MMKNGTGTDDAYHPTDDLERYAKGWGALGDTTYRVGFAFGFFLLTMALGSVFVYFFS